MLLSEALLFSTLSNYSGLTSLVSNRISPMKAVEEGDLPCVTFHQTSGNRDYSHDGPDANVEEWWQFNAFAKDTEMVNGYDQMRAISRAIIDALHAATSFNAFVDGVIDQYQNETLIYHGIVMARIWHV